MIDNNILSNYELVFKFESKWDLMEVACTIKYYDEYPLDDISTVFLSIIGNNGGKIEANTLATMLGFNVVDYFDGEIKRYKDDAEINLFGNFVDAVAQWGLLCRSGENLKITSLGEYALKTNKKYKFYEAKKGLLINRAIYPANSEENMFFPFNSEFKTYTSATSSTPIKYGDNCVDNCFNTEKNDLIKRIELSSIGNCNFYEATEIGHISLSSISVDISLYKNGDEYLPIITRDRQICQVATGLILHESNTTLRERKIEEGLYKRLMGDPDAILDYNSIIPFAEILELDILIKDSRLKWCDAPLFELIAAKADGNDWHSISLNCDIEVIKLYADEYRDRLNWITLSDRINIEFILEYPTFYPWNFEVVRLRADTSIDVIKHLILIPELREEKWDWAEIMSELDREFVLDNLPYIDFDLYQLSRDSESEIKDAIVSYPQKCWDWTYISSEYDLDYLFDNIAKIQSYLNIENVMNRFCIDNSWVKRIGESLMQFVDILTAKPLFSVNCKDYKWNPRLVDLFEKSGHLVWESGKYQDGFECNPYIPWDLRVFNLYSSKISTARGFAHISSNITDGDIVTNNPQFEWDWNAISLNNHLMNNGEFVISVFNKLAVDSFTITADWSTIEFVCGNKENMDSIEKCENAISIFTQKASIDFIRRNLDFQWDWQMVTQRFCLTIKIQFLGNQKWVNKWDWSILTANLKIEDIIEYIGVYKDYWKWDTLSYRLPIDFIKQNLPEYNNYWDWSILLNGKFTKEDLAYDANLIPVINCLSDLEKDVRLEHWRTITRLFNNNELELLIANTVRNSSLIDLCSWDYEYFYSLTEFNLFGYLKQYNDCVSWSELSECQKLNDELHFDKSNFDIKTWKNYVFKELLLNSNYFWDFDKLSKMDNITWTSQVITDPRLINKNWDWAHISRFASFLNKGTDKSVLKLKDYLIFIALSKRTYTELSDRCIETLSHKDWDWVALSSNESINVSVDLMLRLSDKPWDWRALSYRKDIIFDEKLIESLSEKELDWEHISRRADFIPSNSTLDLVAKHTLDWEGISSHKNLNIETLNEKYYNYLNWSAVSRTPNFPIDEIASKKNMWGLVDWYYLSSIDQFPVSVEFLKNVLDKELNWSAVSSNKQLPIEINTLSQFKEYLDWEVINRRLGVNITTELINSFADRLDWTNVSKSQDINFSEQIIEKYEDKWNWTELIKNPKIIVNNGLNLGRYESKLNCVRFLDLFKPHTPKIYHFTHMFNAIEIIKSRKIQSRNRAEGKFANAAGNLVDRRDTAHNYARFYFRPQTPTQFYNECLGKDSRSGYMKEWRYWDGNWIECSKWITYYPQAVHLGLPKCPMPVFFEFDLQEVISNFDKKCYYSTGNMQTNWAKVMKVSESPEQLNTQYLYSTIEDGVEDYKNYSQQEFLIENEFDFSDIESLRIICYDEEQAAILRNLLKEESICSKISIDKSNIFHNGNRKLSIENTDDILIFSSDYNEDACFSIRCTDIQNIEVENPDNILLEGANEIEIYPKAMIKKTLTPFEIYFIDKAIKRREWLIYKN